MYREEQVKLNVGEEVSHLKDKIEKKYGTKISFWQISKESIDARNKKDIKMIYTVDFECSKNINAKKVVVEEYKLPESGKKKLEGRPVIIGFGPCGMLAAIILAQGGYRPIVLERGKPVCERIKDVELFWNEGILDTESNVQFGEGGAGTFSDGKLTTGIKDRRIRKVLEEFVLAGAPEEILYKSKPHIGSDVLREVVKNIRKKVISLGGEVRFQSKVTDIIVEEEKIKAVEINDSEEVETSVAIMALGHSARDTFKRLYERNVKMVSKPFSVGVRVEHMQDLINKSQYGAFADKLPPAEYKLSYRCKNGRGVYTFCMCPGGEVIAAASEKNMTVTNGMSLSARDGRFANSALLVDVIRDDFDGDDPLAGVRFQQKYEKLSYEMSNGYGPLETTWGEFKENDRNKVAQCLPNFVREAYIEAMPKLGKKLKGFDRDDTVMKGVETRSSSPVRILRGENMQADIGGLYPAGEGAGYAGGIISAAIDGIKVAEKIIEEYSK